MIRSENELEIPDRLFFRIGDVAELLGVKPYVLRYWESEFSIISPEKSSTGQRVYKRADVETLLLIKHLLYNERYSIEGARRRIRDLKRSGEWKQARQDALKAGAPDRVDVPESAMVARSALSDQLRLDEVKKELTELRLLASRPGSDFFSL